MDDICSEYEQNTGMLMRPQYSIISTSNTISFEDNWRTVEVQESSTPV